MRFIESVLTMQRCAREWKQKGTMIGLVPTMGYLHEGHLSLVRRARKLVGEKGVVVVSIYVNPTQFGPTEDFSRYPRDMQRDRKLCRQAGVDVIFAPANDQIYPGRDTGAYSTYVTEEVLTRYMEGASRPGHFRGVTTIVAKLFNIVLPDVAVFGAKDFQQAAVIRRMVQDLNFPLKIVVAPTLREKDGLAMSSRNKYLLGELRTQATVLIKAIRLATEAVTSTSKGVSSATLKQKLKKFIELQPAARVDYIEIFDPLTLQPLAEARRGSQIALAVYIGKTRLIDNARL